MSTQPIDYFPDLESRAEREIFPGVDIKIIYGKNLMLWRVALAPNSVVPPHQHPNEQYGMVLEGEVTFTIGGESKLLRPGAYYAIPGDTLHGVVTGPDGAVCLDIFSPPREGF